MLDLHRASAGSGKTYTLAKKFIWYLITIKEEDRPRRLRRDNEIADSARHILAVTFTNKATNEMQQRIVQRLDDLAHMAPVYETDDRGRRFIKKPDYMQEFCDDLHETPGRIAQVCAKALGSLLENYSDFKVSTIDSFFQLVLRTFAYESELNDAYQIELDSEYLSQMAVNSTLEAFDSDEQTKDVRAAGEISDAMYWIGKLMDGAEKSWNIFARKINARNDDAPYKALIKSVKRLENEDYKIKRKEIDAYLADNHNLIDVYKTLDGFYDKKVTKAFKSFRTATRNLKENLPSNILDKGQAGRDLKALLTRLLSYAGHKPMKGGDAPDEKIADYFDKVLTADSIKAMEKKFGATEWISTDLPECQKRFDSWLAELNNPDYRTWRVYARNLPYFALFGIINRKRQEFLAETNSVELGETSMILREVINDSDAPFVYERLGSVLNHFLIDEFQDTSRLQWENLRPLLEESMSRDNESLIIGDAKQSIYRFRNADSSLITSVVPDHFAGRVHTRGTLPQDNKNFRSELHVVQFNNSFFEYLVKRLDAAQDDAPHRQIFKSLYENVVQLPNRRDDRGFVQLTVAGKEQTDFKAWTLARVPELIHELLKRGYDQKDIAILVYSGAEGQGTDVIDSILKYNIEHPELRPISFVSEQSLLVKNSAAVKLIVGVLRNMARGFNPRFNAPEDRRKFGVGRWSDMETRFKFFAMGRNEPMAELLDEFIQAEPNLDGITGMLDRLNSLSIPAIVEAVVATFMPDSLKKSDAVFISAFQDIVLEYCERRPTDIGSFLEWWERRSRSASISSPEDIDAVQILTYHKSKGLEYDCVIIPFADWNMSDYVDPKKVEWRWLRPVLPLQDGVELPPYVPVNIDKQLLDSAHEPALTEFFDELKTDFLNQAYVAFTRAAKELYIFSGSKKKSKKEVEVSNYCKFNDYLLDFAKGMGGNTGAEDISRLDTDQIELTIPDDNKAPIVASFGVPGPYKDPDQENESDADADEEKVDKNNEGGGDESAVNKKVIEDYSSTLISKLSIRQENLPSSINKIDPDKKEGEEEDNEEEELDLDPRSEGNIKHAVLELVKVREDLPAAIRHFTITGLLVPELAEEIEANLAEKLSIPEVAEWFDGTARVVNERSLLRAGYVSRRPDRILIYPDGRAVVVDYKFGQYPGSKKYREQIQRYVRLLRATGSFRTVEGYLWFVNDNIIESHTGITMEVGM